MPFGLEEKIAVKTHGDMNSGLTEFEEFLKPALAEDCGQANVEVYYHAYKACVEVLVHNERILTGREFSILILRRLISSCVIVNYRTIFSQGEITKLR